PTSPSTTHCARAHYPSLRHHPPPCEIYPPSLHDALPICKFSLSLQNKQSILVVTYIGYNTKEIPAGNGSPLTIQLQDDTQNLDEDRKSTRLNSSHVSISYAVFCLKKKNK